MGNAPSTRGGGTDPGSRWLPSLANSEAPKPHMPRARAALQLKQTVIHKTDIARIHKLGRRPRRKDDFDDRTSQGI